MRPAAYLALAVAVSLAALGAGGAAAQSSLVPKPKLRPIHAVFTPAPAGQSCGPPFCTTVYTEKATGQQLRYRWKVTIPIDPPCAKGFKGNKPTANAATWYHADASEGGYCNHTGKDYDDNGIGHPGTVVVTVTNAAWRCIARFRGTQGPLGQPTWNGPPPGRCRPR